MPPSQSPPKGRELYRVTFHHPKGSTSPRGHLALHTPTVPAIMTKAKEHMANDECHRHLGLFGLLQNGYVLRPMYTHEFLRISVHAARIPMIGSIHFVKNY